MDSLDVDGLAAFGEGMRRISASTAEHSDPVFLDLGAASPEVRVRDLV